MAQEEKGLLLKDLSARLPYDVYAETVNELGETHINKICSENINLVTSSWFKECKPYLRPMSSMTEEEKEKLSHLLPKDWSVEIDKLNNFYFDMNPSIFIEIDVFLNIIDWLNKNMFDYRGLIPLGLALEALEGMYK